MSDPVWTRAEQDTLTRIEETCVCSSLRKAARLVTRRFDEVYREAGLRSTQAPILMELAMRGPLNMTSLAKLLAVDKSTLSRNVIRLEEQRLVGRRNGDNGQVELFATGEGIARMRKLLPLWEKAQSEMLDIISDQNWRGLLGASAEIQSRSDS